MTIPLISSGLPDNFINGILDKLSDFQEKAKGDFDAAVSGASSTDPQSLMKIQASMFQYQSSSTLISNVVKTVEELLKGVLQNIR